MRFFLCLILFFSYLNAEGLGIDGSYLSAQDKMDRVEEAVSSILSKCGKVGLKTSEIREIVYFIENDLSEYIAYSEYFLDRSITNLPCDIEYDPSTGFLFIHLNNFCSKSSKKKVITKAIQYDIKNPQIVAVIVSKLPELLQKEIEVLKQLKGIEHAIQLIGAPQHRENDQIIQEMIVPFYEDGDLKKLKEELTLKEKICLATDLMKLVKEIHERGLIHEDIHKGNLLLDINKDKKLQGVRYRLVLIDWEKAVSVDEFSYRKRKDLYFVGCTLYCLLHGGKCSKTLYRNVSQFEVVFAEAQAKMDSNKLILGEVSEEITKRKKELDRKSKNKSMTIQEEFEWMILSMMHPTYKGSEDAAYWYNKYSKLLTEKQLN